MVSKRWTPDWRRVMRWCLLGTTVMFLWLIAPVVKCSFRAFQDTPLSEVDEHVAVSQTDANRVDQSKGFVEKVTTAAQVCYARTPLLGQEPWKANLGGKISQDPWKHDYVYRAVPAANPADDAFVVLSLGPDGKEGTADDVGADVANRIARRLDADSRPPDYVLEHLRSATRFQSG